jgi:single-strand DNA-binding protein
MAKENYVLLIGEVQGVPVINQDKGKAKYVIKTLRRNNKIDYPVISVLSEELIEKVETFKERDFIIVKGLLATNEVKKGVCCPNCNEIIRTEGTVTEIIAIENINIGSNYKLEDLKEISNTAMLLGSLCRDTEFRLLANTGIPSAQYQLAINRKYNVKRQQQNHTDYPWINSFGKQAEQDALRLQTGSQVFVQGGIQTRNVQKTIVCPECNTEFKAEDFVAEVVPYSVEYLNNCKFGD